MGFQYTKDQQKVIELRNRNILVAAAAGSGKTAVLVERIIQLISEGDSKTDIDRLLIVTFTSAAADEMRERISEGIQKKLAQDPFCEHMQKQATLIYHAQITTISSFCLHLIKNHFHDIELDPTMRVGDEGECKLMKLETLEEVLESHFQKKEETFYYFVETFSANGNEKGLEELILQLHETSRSYPFPKKWLQECKTAYENVTIEQASQLGWIQFMLSYTQMVIRDCTIQLQQGMRVCDDSDGPYMYKGVLEEDVAMLERAIGMVNIEEIYEVIHGIKFGRLPSKKDDSISVKKRELVKEIRNQVKDDLKKIQSLFYYDTTVNQLKIQEKSALVVKVLIEVTLDFYLAYQCKKREKGVLDFSDMEHYALAILLEQKEDGEFHPTDTAKIYQRYFTEILIDEYQDSNLVQEYLLKSVSKESSGSYNQFMVGDVKQSIYKFRLARPELFMEKYYGYTIEDSNMQKINLSQNFRSRQEVLSVVNYLFEQIMIPQIGGIAYDQDAALYQGAVYPCVENQEQDAELLLMEQGDSKEDKKELEARMIGKRIQELVETFYITDQKTGELRLAEYGDIVILVRSNARWDAPFKEELEREGIPTHIVSKTGYFLVYEVQLVLHFLRVFDNPLQDISITAVLLSGVMGVAEEELAIVKSEWKAQGGKKKEYIYSLLKWYEKQGKNEILIAKIEKILAFIDKFRQMTTYTPINELIQALMQEKNLQLYLSTMPLGEQRKGNLDMLLEKAVQFEQTSYHGLFHFVRYIEQLEKYQVNFGEANLLDEKANVVRIMSIHKSKGLEFPICIVAGLGKQFNKMDVRKDVVIDMDYGIGMNDLNPIARTKNRTLQKEVMIQKMELENMGEEIRILYVALTRAKEKLILTGVIGDKEKLVKTVEKHRLTSTSNYTFGQIRKAKSFLDLILLGLARHPEMDKITEDIRSSKGNCIEYETNVILKMYQDTDIEQQELVRTIKKTITKMGFRERMELVDSDKRMEDIIERNFTYEYPLEELSTIYSKTTVTEIKKKRMLEEIEEVKELFQEEEASPYLPIFMQEKNVSGMERGNAYHKVMEVLCFKEGIVVEEELSRLVEQGYLSEAYYKMLDVKKVERFLKSSLGVRMIRSEADGVLYKEQPFVISLPANEVEAHFSKNESILLQGIVDAYFEEEGELVIVDYKTDLIRNIEQLRERYEIQVKYYAKSLAQLTGKVVKEILLYSFALDEVCTMKPERSQ
ncbi:MAG: helicase-exonuclease AddAB subunit AddA [Eubacteriales bacterium]